MAQSRTLAVGLAVHTDAIAGASVATDHGAAGVYRGTMGTRHGDLDQRIRHRPSKATPPLLGDAAGPCGAWLSRDRRHTGDDCGVVAPALLPQKAGDRVQPLPGHWPGGCARVISPPSRSPRTQRPPCGISPAPATRPCGSSKPRPVA
jgi:hypothetical protein